MNGPRRLLAIDPGNTESAYVTVDTHTHRPLTFGKIPNLELRDRLWTATPTAIHADTAAIEMIASYGMPVGREVFDTCVWIGRFHAAIEVHTGDAPDLIYRKPIKLHHCGSARAKDSNITQALVDRFADGASNHGKGTKAEPGWFYGFKADIWQAYALAVYAVDMLLLGPATPAVTTHAPVAAADSPYPAATGPRTAVPVVGGEATTGTATHRGQGVLL